MADYAYSAGFQVPGKILQSLNELAKYFPTCPETVGSGYKVAPETKEINVVSQPVITVDLAKKMSNIHNKLSEIVTPARPGTLFLFAQERRKFKRWYIWGPVPLIRYMVFLAIFSLITFIALGVALSNYVPDISNRSMFELDGWALILNLVFLLTAASSGPMGKEVSMRFWIRIYRIKDILIFQNRGVNGGRGRNLI